MTVDQRIQYGVNLVCAVFAFGVNVWAAIRPGLFREWVPIRLAVAFLASLYAASYALLLAGVLSIPDRATFALMLSPLAWLIVWCGPVLWTHALWRAARRNAERQVRDRVDHW